MSPSTSCELKKLFVARFIRFYYKEYAQLWGRMPWKESSIIVKNSILRGWSS